MDLDGTEEQRVVEVREGTSELRKIHLADSPDQRTSARPDGHTAQSPYPRSSQSSGQVMGSLLPLALVR